MWTLLVLQGYSVVCVEEACQANEMCGSFSNCVLSGQCMKSAQEKADQSTKWLLKQGSLDRSAATGAVKTQQAHNCAKGTARSAMLDQFRKISKTGNSEWLASKSVTALEVQRPFQHNLSTPISEYKRYFLSAPKDDANVNKKQKLDHTQSGSSILYKPPSVSWILPANICTQTPSRKCLENPTRALELQNDAVNDNKMWLSSAETAVIKAAFEKENNFCRDSIMNNFENLADKVENISFDTKSSTPILSDLEMKEFWLLQQYPNTNDNKIMEEIMNKKYELEGIISKSDWQSISSLCSFSVITETDSLNDNSSWLISKQL